MKLKTQFFLSHALIAVAASAIVAAAVYASQKKLLAERLAAEESRQADVFAEVCRQSSLMRNEILLAGYVKLLSRSPAVAYAGFIAPDGRVRMHTDVRCLSLPESSCEAAPAAPRQERLVTVDEGQNGRAVLGFSAAYRAGLLRAAARRTAAGVAAAAGGGLLIALLAAALLAAVMIRPLQTMAAAAQDIGRGDFTARAVVRASRELESLAKTLNDMAAQLAALDEMKEEVISVLSHDLRAPLAAIASFSETLLEGRRGPVTEVQKEYLGIVHGKAGELIRFADSLLEVARMKAGKLDIVPLPFPARPLLEKVAALYQAAAGQKNASISVEADASLRVQADEEKIERVLVNLISNALKYVPPQNGSVILKATADDDGIRFGVADNGKGIAAEDLPRLFQKFSRVDVEGQKKNRIKGVGLGLTIVKGLVEAHGGRVGVESTPGQGSFFYFSLERAPS
jgi:signal transduction histidine kinase